MEHNGDDARSTGLPYLNNFWTIPGIAAFNAACVLAFNLWRDVAARNVILSAALMLPIMFISRAAFWSVLTFFGFETLNFFQFFFTRTCMSR